MTYHEWFRGLSTDTIERMAPDVVQMMLDARRNGGPQADQAVTLWLAMSDVWAERRGERQAPQPSAQRSADEPANGGAWWPALPVPAAAQRPITAGRAHTVALALVVAFVVLILLSAVGGAV